MKYLIIGFLSVLLLFGGCSAPSDGEAGGDYYLFLNDGGLAGALASGDIFQVGEDELRVTNLLSGRDTTLGLGAVRNVLSVEASGTPRVIGNTDRQRLIALDRPTLDLDTTWITREPFEYTYLGQTYWASFEPSFTGFPVYARPNALDFVNRLVDWSATAPGLEFSEFSLYNSFGQPVIVLSERERGQYRDSQIILVDSVGDKQFTGRIVMGAPRGEVPITFTRTDGVANDYPPDAFIEEVNRGFSRSYLLLERNRPMATPTDEKRLPRRSFIDPGDLGAISASFLDDGSVMLLSDDHIVLQGSYVLDLDKGLLTVTDDTGASYRIFVDTGEGIHFTVPVSVVELEGGRLVGEDNYLRIDVVEG
ncbi:hypothetical protein [Lewinella sp. IMCC34191]|uniref:hypothetical protein n=1 Tax=Lewinella sp. IMCC34191 TaxID=2259172 RepID=UPI000E227D8F|nr:hypothetical protein [Lewinella sp. IMCC34191]